MALCNRVSEVAQANTAFVLVLGWFGHHSQVLVVRQGHRVAGRSWAQLALPDVSDSLDSLGWQGGARSMFEALPRRSLFVY